MSELPDGVEVVFALADEQRVITVPFCDELTVAAAIDQSGIVGLFPDYDVAAMKLAIWGQLAGPDAVLRPGDRVEILRPLQIDPRIARRELAKGGQTMDGMLPGESAGEQCEGDS